ncbi:MAG: carbohydrate ABC transporter permease [Candidatus Gallimonas sp.]
MTKTKRKHLKSKQEIIVTAIVCPILFVWSVTLLYPYLWAFLNSLKTPGEFLLDSFSLPDKWLFSNWGTAIQTLRVQKSNPLESVGIIGMIINSIWWMFGSVAVNTIVTVMMAYGLAKYHFRVGKFLHAFSLVVMTITVVGAFPSQYALYNKLGITNSPAMLLTSAGCIGTSSLLIYYSFFKGISWSYAEAVFIDGGGHWTVFLRIMVPQAAPIISAMMVIGCIGMWNDYFTPYIYLRDFPTLATGLYVLQTSSLTANNKPLYFAVVLLSALPIFVIFMCFQEKIMTSVSMGGLKG